MVKGASMCFGRSDTRIAWDMADNPELDTGKILDAELAKFASQDSNTTVSVIVEMALPPSQVELTDVADFSSETGKGVSGKVDGRLVTLGNESMMTDSGVAVEAIEAQADEMRASAQTVMYVSIDGALAGMVGVADPIKESTPEAVKALREDGIRIVMLTGDSQRTADAVAGQLGISDVVAGGAARRQGCGS